VSVQDLRLVRYAGSRASSALHFSVGPDQPRPGLDERLLFNAIGPSCILPLGVSHDAPPCGRVGETNVASSRDICERAEPQCTSTGRSRHVVPNEGPYSKSGWRFLISGTSRRSSRVQQRRLSPRRPPPRTSSNASHGGAPGSSQIEGSSEAHTDRFDPRGIHVGSPQQMNQRRMTALACRGALP
jgi:hypothetical protein